MNSLQHAESQAMDPASPEAPRAFEKDGSKPRSNGQRLDRRFLGWRVGIAAVCCLVFLVLLINIGFLAWASSNRKIQGGIGTLQRGSCKTSERLDTWLHLAINILSTGMLSGSNYCMLIEDEDIHQILLSPADFQRYATSLGTYKDRGRRRPYER